MSVQARFFVQSISKYAANSVGGQVVLSAVCRGPENKTWAAATPSGKIEMTVNNPSAFSWFESMLGEELALTFEPRPALCEVCGEEVPAQYEDVPQQRWGTTDYGTEAKLFRHQGCTPPA